MPWLLEKTFVFSAAHTLPHHDGKCRNQHGHNFKGTLYLESYTLQITGPKRGMVIDFSEVKEALKELLESTLDHKDLNHTTLIESPTSEELARYIYRMLKPNLPMLIAVKIEETDGCAATYRE